MGLCHSCILLKIRKRDLKKEKTRRKVMAVKPYLLKFPQLLASLFPSARSYFNFWMIWTFFTVLFFVKEPQIVLIAALATGYFLNEWIKERSKKETTRQ